MEQIYQTNFNFIDNMSKKELKSYRKKIVERKEDLEDLILYVNSKL